MKTIKKLTLSTAFLFISAFGMANEMDLRIFTDKESKTLLFNYTNSSTDAELRFVDGEGNVIFTESLEDNSEYSKKFNLGNLESGVYTLEVEDAIKETEFTITLEDYTVAIKNKSERTKPVFRTKDHMVYLNLLNLEKEDVAIAVYDEDERMVASKIVENEQVIEKAFNFKEAHRGHYTIKVKKGNDTFYEEINVD
ncbi:hypothetical protein [Maribacter polysaccharolyticus]|uniref:hypothetical protein n=1 Tax=Maribacter polysaccharolyticus TaxID=3020831 RepID=UPI00237F97FC|nr:hypothetical protein [Maribacter polysaccharolyticus]MDE3741382.1 hypothetical protein [Maribacter polysaccharolyticus]